MRRHRLTACLFAMLMALSSVGCNSLQSGDLRSLQTISQDSQQTTPVILIRGWRDLWSDGIDRLAAELRKDGIAAEVFKESQAREVGSFLVERAKQNALQGPIVLIGFSYGADDVIDMAIKLRDANSGVNLLVLIDPVTPAPIPYHVLRCVNFYQPNGIWDEFPWLRGVPVERAQWKTGDGSVPCVIENIDVRKREDLNSADMSHKTIAGNEKIHGAIIREVKNALRLSGATRQSMN